MWRYSALHTRGDTDDARGSPARSIIDRLRQVVNEVTAFDSRTKERFGATDAKNLRDAMNKADCIVIVADHSEFRRMSLR